MVIDKYDENLLYINRNGKKCYFVGQRLSDNRKQKGESDITKPMTQEEKQQNVLLIIQVPLKDKVGEYLRKDTKMDVIITTLTGSQMKVGC